MALSFANISIELREILLKNKPDELYEISPKGTVPVLQTEQKVIDESIDIMLWAMDKLDSSSEILSEIDLQREMIYLNDTEFKKWLDRYKYNDRYEEFSMDECKLECKIIIDKYEDNIEYFNFLLGDSISLVDIAIFPFIRQFANVNMDYFSSTYPKTKNWLDKMIESDLFKSVMKKYPQWQIGDSSKIVNFKSEFIEA